MFTPHLKLRVEFSGGTSIEEAAVEAIEFAKKMECDIAFNFNGIELLAYSTLAAKDLVNEYFARL